jgi:hypothetical protein
MFNDLAELDALPSPVNQQDLAHGAFLRLGELYVKGKNIFVSLTHNMSA